MANTLANTFRRTVRLERQPATPRLPVVAKPRRSFFPDPSLRFGELLGVDLVQLFELRDFKPRAVPLGPTVIRATTVLVR